jgi:hypothetical protein
MDWSSCEEANSRSDSQEIPRLLWNPKVQAVFTEVRLGTGTKFLTLCRYRFSK